TWPRRCRCWPAGRRSPPWCRALPRPRPWAPAYPGRPLAWASMRIRVVSDIHGAAGALARESATADALLVCGDLVNLIDYRAMRGVAAEVFGPEVTAAFVRHRTAGRFEVAERVLRGASAGREDEIREQVRAACRAHDE